MKRTRIVWGLLAALLLAAGSLAPTLAQEQKAAPKAKREQLRDKLRNLTPEERRAELKKLRAQADQRRAALQAKKDAGTITEQEAKELTRLEVRLKKVDERQQHKGKRPGHAPKRGAKPGPQDN
ncbi:MAG: hypothetical protein HYY24_18690 [Verrucomicrobia bacterium]|nr:hypothetical protein [Verrucomicrobiota bacterium]